MAALENDHLVVNVVYAGPPLAGKTHSVMALMPQLMGRGAEEKVFSPGDWRGRTAFFDWAVYEGGAFDGKPIQCRIMTTPGQVALSDRREMLLRTADAVILVIDSQAEALERAVHCYEEMAPWLAESSRDSPVRVVLQCNKQDLPGSLSPDELNRRLGVPCGKDVYPTSASTGKGLRAAFVAGVRNAVERARALVARGLVLEPPEITSGEQLLERMRRDALPSGSLRPTPSLSVPAATPISPTTRPAPERSAAARGRGRSKVESARPGGAHDLGNAPASGSAAASGDRPAASKQGRALGADVDAPKLAGQPPFPLGVRKPVAASSCPPGASPRSASSAERAATSHPPLPPDHPFASNLPALPSTRRPRSASSPRARSAAGSRGGGSAERSARSKASDMAATEASHPANDAPGGRRRQASAAPMAARAAAAGVLHAAATRQRSDHAAAGEAQAAPTDTVAGRSSGDAATASCRHSDTRSAIAAGLARAVAGAAAARALGPMGSGSSVAPVVPATQAPASAPPSSATASAPARSARRAITEPRSEPEPSATTVAAPPPEARRGLSAAAAAAERQAQANPADAGRRDGRSERPGQVPSGAAAVRTDVRAFVAGGPRPAVMPASAWRAALVAEADTPTQSQPAAAAPSQPALAVPTAHGLDARPPLGVDGDLVDSGWPEAGEVLSSIPPSESSMQRLPAKSAGPVMIPASTERGVVARGELPNEGGAVGRQQPAGGASSAAQGTGADAAATGEPADVAAAAGDSPRAGSSAPLTDGSDNASETVADGEPAGAGLPTHERPTLAPSPPSNLLLSTERPTIAPSAPSEPKGATDQPAARVEFADPAMFGLESSRLIEPMVGASDESNESFRIPETPPGLQAFVAKARLSTPPPYTPPPGDDVIPSLAPSRSDETALGADGTQPLPPIEFGGPRMPGHARAPRAVWRRSTWRTLEMHITSDAVALEDARGRWIGELAPGWYARTLRSAHDARSAHRAFAEEVLRERRLGQYLSRPRCVALTDEADRFWIWQAACRVPTLAAVLGRRLAARESPSAMAEALLDASLAFVEARQRFTQARVPLPLSLHALSVQDDKLVYSGLLPDPGAVFVHPPSDGHTAFEDALRKKWPSAPVDGNAVFVELSSKAAGRLPEPILQIIHSVVGPSSLETSTNGASG